MKRSVYSAIEKALEWRKELWAVLVKIMSLIDYDILSSVKGKGKNIALSFYTKFVYR